VDVPIINGQTNADAAGCSSTATGQLTAAQVAAYAQEAGFSNTVIDKTTGLPALVVAVALTEPESGANSTAVQQGQPTSSTGWGLWQLTPGGPQDLSPLTNAKGAYAKWQAAGGFSPWTTYGGGEFEAFVAWAKQGVANMSSATGVSCTAGGLAAGPAGPTGQVAQQATPAGLPASFEGFPFGQCTFWAALHATVTWSGNAADWWDNSPANLHVSTPVVGEIVVYGSGNGYSSLGHVALVIQVSGQNFQVSEMNYLGVGVVDDRWDELGPGRDILGFIK
jgi:surface antigen